MPVQPQLHLGGMSDHRSPPGLFHPSRAESGVPITRRSGKKYQTVQSVAKTLPVPFVLYADFEAFLVPAEETKESASNTKVRQLHKPSGFGCLRISQVPEFNGEIFTYSGENWMTVFCEDQDRYVRSILSDVKPMKTLSAEQQLQYGAATTCELCHANSLKTTKDETSLSSLRTLHRSLLQYMQFETEI